MGLLGGLGDRFSAWLGQGPRKRALRERRERLERAIAPEPLPTFAVVAADPAAIAECDYPAATVVADLGAASAEFVVLLGPGDRLLPEALIAFAEAVLATPGVDLVYGDEAGPDGAPFHKPDWSPELLLAQPYVLRPAAWRLVNLHAVGGPKAAAGTAAEYDLALRACDVARRIVHVPEVLCRRGRAWAPTDDDCQCVAAAAARRGLTATVRPVDGAAVLGLELRPRTAPEVTIVVPTRDRLDLVGRCVASLRSRTAYPNWRLLVVDNGSVEPATLAALAEWRADARIAVLRDDEPFDYARLMNRAVAAVQSPLVAFLNNDTEVIAERWLDELVAWLEQPDVGVVGGKLYYPDDTIQHAGVVLGIGGVASHGHKRFPRLSGGYHGLLHSVRDVSAVTGACMLTRRDLFVGLGGFATDLRVAYNDVDYCLRVRQSGQRVLFVPRAELYHHEGQSRGDDQRGASRFDREIRTMEARWGQSLLRDPFYNPNLSLTATDYRLAKERRVGG